MRFPEQGVFCVADGMGGIHGGEVASRAVVDGLRRDFEAVARAAMPAGLAKRVEVVHRSLNDSSNWIKSYGEERAAGGAGTTALVFVADPVNPRRAAMLHAGDSRAYVYRKGSLTALTKDHSVAAAAGVRAESALPSMFRGVITRAVGLEREVTPELTKVMVEPDDLFLLSTDGLTKQLDDDRIAQVVAENPGAGLEEVARALVAAANAAGGDDNISVLLIRAAATLPDAAAGVDEEPLPDFIPPPQATPPAGSADTAADTGRGMTERWTDAGDFAGGAPGPDDEATMALGRTPSLGAPSGPPSGRAAAEGDTLTPISQVFPPQQLDVAGSSPPPLTETALPPAADRPRPGPAPAGRTLLAAGAIALVAFGVVATLCGPKTLISSSGAGGVAPAPDSPLAAAVATLRVDVREALFTGRWDAMEAGAAELRAKHPGMDEGLLEWRILAAWSREWKKVQAGSGLARQIYTDLDAAAREALLTAGLKLSEAEEPAWRGDPAAQASAYCAAAHALQRGVMDAISGYADARVAEVARIGDELLPRLAWLQRDISVSSASAQESFASLRTAVADLKQWSDRNATSRLPPSPSLFGEAGAILAGVERREDEFYDRLAGAIRYWGAANMPAMTTDAARQRGLLALYSRICNGRDRHGTNVKAWREGGGQEDVTGFFRLLDQTFPAKDAQKPAG